MRTGSRTKGRYLGGQEEEVAANTDDHNDDDDDDGHNAVWNIYRYDTGIWGFIDSFRVVLVCGMRKWYTNFIDSARGNRWKCTAKGKYDW